MHIFILKRLTCAKTSLICLSATSLDSKTDSSYSLHSQFHFLKKTNKQKKHTYSLSFSFTCRSFSLEAMRVLKYSGAFWAPTNTSLAVPERLVYVHEKQSQMTIDVLTIHYYSSRSCFQVSDFTQKESLKLQQCLAPEQ